MQLNCIACRRFMQEKHIGYLAILDVLEKRFTQLWRHIIRQRQVTQFTVNDVNPINAQVRRPQKLYNLVAHPFVSLTFTAAEVARNSRLWVYRSQTQTKPIEYGQQLLGIQLNRR